MQMSSRKRYNRQTPEYVDSLILDNLLDLESYNGYEFNRYHYDFVNDKLYLYTRHKYKLIKPTFNGLMHLVALFDVNGKPHTCGYNKLMRELKEIARKDGLINEEPVNEINNEPDESSH